MIDKALSALMIVKNFEKIADHAKSIAGCVLFWMEGTDVDAGTLNGSHSVMPEVPQEHWGRKLSR
jgi:phosphate uptake regulator